LIYAPSWSWLYGSWIYNYLCKQWISPLTLWVRTRSGEVYSIQLYAIIFVSDLRQIGFLRVSSTNTNCRHDTTGIIYNKILFKLRSDAYKYFYFVKKKKNTKKTICGYFDNILSTLLHLLPMTCQPEGNTYRFEILVNSLAVFLKEPIV
jgi:hypothetical protein